MRYGLPASPNACDIKIWKASAVLRLLGSTTYYRNIKMICRTFLYGKNRKSSYSNRIEDSMQCNCTMISSSTVWLHCTESSMVQLKNHMAIWQLIFQTFDSKLILNSRTRFNRIVFICVIVVPHEYQLNLHYLRKRSLACMKILALSFYFDNFYIDYWCVRYCYQQWWSKS